MSQFDSLPADQKAVLQLLLRQGRSYDELSGLLKLEPGAVRERAHRALDALGPDDGASLSDDRRGEVSDWLLGQQSDGDAERTSAFLAGSGSGRAWARTVGDQLRPVGGERIPEVPAEGRPAAAPAATPVAATPVAAASGPGAAAATEAAAPAAMTPGGHRVSRRGGAFLIGGVLAAAAVILVLVLLLSGGDDKKSNAKTSASASTPTSTTAAQPTVRAQINLTAPGAGSSTKRAGILWILDASGKPAFTAAAQGLPTTKGRAYGIWFYTSQTQAKLIGGFDQYDKQGRILASGALSADPTQYKDIIVTAEKGGQPKTPGRIVLQGAIANATAPSTGTGTTTTP